MAQINGPRLAPRSGQAKQLVVFLHGYGADGNDLIEIGRQWQPWLPEAAFVAPHAPEPCAQSPMGRQWFSLTFRDPHERWRGVQHASPSLDAFLEAELASHNLPASKLALVGFSQGTMMALHIGLRRQTAPAAIVGFSGMVVTEEGKGPESLAPQVRSKPPILLVHGDRDEVIPVDALFLSTDALAAAEVPCQWHLSIGLGHGIDAEALRHGGLFLAQSFGLPSPRESIFR
jgi:phospholipase/carboxylesterase